MIFQAYEMLLKIFSEEKEMMKMYKCKSKFFKIWRYPGVVL